MKPIQFWHDHRATIQGGGLLLGPILALIGYVLLAIGVLTYPAWGIAGAGVFVFALAALGMLHTQYGEIELLQAKNAVLTDASTPRLEVELHSVAGLRFTGDDRTTQCYLKITNTRGGQVRRAYGQLAEVIEHIPPNVEGSTRPSRRRLYHQKDVFLRWEGQSNDRFRDFHDSGTLLVARGRSGDGNYGLSVVGDNLFPGLHLYEIYELRLVLAADDIPAQTVNVFLRMSSCTTRDDEGNVTLWIDVPFECEFREWRNEDQVEDELDLDAI